MNIIEDAKTFQKFGGGDRVSMPNLVLSFLEGVFIVSKKQAIRNKSTGTSDWLGMSNRSHIRLSD